MISIFQCSLVLPNYNIFQKLISDFLKLKSGNFLLFHL